MNIGLLKHHHFFFCPDGMLTSALWTLLDLFICKANELTPERFIASSTGYCSLWVTFLIFFELCLSKLMVTPFVLLYIIKRGISTYTYEIVELTIHGYWVMASCISLLSLMALSWLPSAATELRISFACLRMLYSSSGYSVLMTLKKYVLSSCLPLLILGGNRGTTNGLAAYSSYRPLTEISG